MRCPPARRGAPAGDLHRPGRPEVWADGSGIQVLDEPDAPARLISWEEIGWFRDGWHSPGLRSPGWMLHIVLADGHVEQVTETWTEGRAQAPPELLALIRRAAAAHSVPAVLTGGKVLDGRSSHEVLCGNAGLYYDPAGKPGLREWTGTEWSPFLQVDPGASGHPGQETGLARIWSPLSPEELHRHSRAVMEYTRRPKAVSAGCMAFPTLVLAVFAVLLASGHLDGSSGSPLAAWAGAVCVLSGAFAGYIASEVRRRKRVALALSGAATRALAQDDPPAPIEPPDLRTN